MMNLLRLLAKLVILVTAALWGLAALASWGGPEPMSLSPSDQKVLLKLARSTIRAHLKNEMLPPLKDAPPILKEPRGVFVSLHRRGQLRGCIGYLEAIKPLGQAVEEMAVAAAFHDPRFPSLREEELADLDLEISILTPMQRLDKVEDIVVGKHGLYIEYGFNRGLLLPQVATQYHWNRQTFLEQTCCKAGLPPDAWKDKAAKIYTFTAEIISDHPE